MNSKSHAHWCERSRNLPLTTGARLRDLEDILKKESD